MKDLFEYAKNIDVSLQYICEATPEDRAINKWLKQHKCVKIKAVDGELVLSGRTNAIENEFNLLPGEETLPDNIKFADWKNSCALTITAPSAKSVSWAPVSENDGECYFKDCKTLEDFDCDYSNYNGRCLTFKDCDRLKSFSGLKNIKRKHPIMIDFYNCASIKSLKQLDGVNYMLGNISGCPIKNLEGSKTWNGYNDTLINGLPELESFDGAIFKDFTGINKELYSFGAKDCPKLKRLGKVDFCNSKIRYIYFWNCPSIGREMIQDLIDNVPFDKSEDEFGGFKCIFGKCGIDEERDKDLLDKLSEVSGLNVEIYK